MTVPPLPRPPRHDDGPDWVIPAVLVLGLLVLVLLALL